MSVRHLYFLVFALVCRLACYASTIEAKSEAVSVDITDARDYATAEAKAKLEIKFKSVLEAIVSDYENSCGSYTIPSQELTEKVYKSVFSTYINYEQKMAKTWNDGQECYYVIVTVSINSERLIMAMERFLLPKAGENRRGHEKKVKQLRQVIEEQFETYNQSLTDTPPHATRTRNKKR